MHPRDDERGKMEALLHQIVLEEQQKMVQLGFVETCIPSPDSPARCSIFMSANWHICRRLLLVIVSGNGIQPGIWSRSLVLEATENPNQYRSGSMLPYLHTALSKGYGVVVMNPSTNTVSVGSEKIPIPYSSTPELHVRYVWETYGVRASCSQVYIAAYGRGGSLTKHLVCTQPLLRSKLAAIAFIESSHRVETDDTQEVRGLLGTRAINWQRSKESPGTQLQDCTQLGCLSLSAGEPTSPAEQKSSNTAWTIAASMDTVFAFFDSARGSMPDEPAEDELMDEMSRLSQYAYAGAAAMSSAPHQQEHMEDAEFHVEEDVGNHLGRRSNSARSSRRSMVISTSMSVNDFDLLSVVGHTPFWDKNRRQMFQNILSKEPTYPPELFSPTATDFLQRLLVKNPRQRLGCGADGALEIMGHPWFEGVDWDALLNRRVEPPFRPVTKDIHGSRARTSSAALNANLQYVPNIFKQQEVADSPVVSVLGSSTGSGIMAMHFDDFSYMGSDIIGSRRTSVFRDSDIKMELGE
ncbi:hypothetical protein PC129_g1110 [Phytophthora cactorum]|uniref:AGC-kinase C-terminal domain-containing protein n=1 Tax=Phytophthora cactorum TaxID=29920 RepID=A0A8T1ISB3_9STRA|nr:hypothetical protein PC129_g1110 [Phytophthora cactorum]